MSIFTIFGALPHVNDQKYDYAVIFKPGTELLESYQKIVDAGGTPIRSGQYDFIIIASFESYTDLENAYKNGALLILNPAITGGCYIQSKNKFVTT